MSAYILALDQGTTSSRAVLFSEKGEIAASAQVPFHQIYPQPGWVEQNPEEILASQFRALSECFAKSGLKPGQIAGIGVTNQRETVVIWSRKTGKPVCNAIVWQCRRTAPLCERLKAEGCEETVRKKTGLRLDAYFSATKIRWILDHVAGAKERAEQGELICGTIDSWLIWNLTGGQVHVSDYSNCSRTMLFDIRQLCWDEELCRMFGVPLALLPEPVPNSREYGRIAEGIPGLEELAGIPICGAAGDQQAALFGQACFKPGQVKNTYGTGCFALMNTGNVPVFSEHGLVSSVGWSLNGELSYILEGSVFNAGSTIQWLRDELGVIKTAHECDVLAESVSDSGGVYLVSAFTGLGAPCWDMYARGTIVGLTRGTSRSHLCRAALEGIAFQTADLIRAMEQDARDKMSLLRVDGGACVSDIMMQFEADLLGITVERPAVSETTAWGAACLAGLATGVWRDLKQLSEIRRIERVFQPKVSREREYKVWRRAVNRALAWAEQEEREP